MRTSFFRKLSPLLILTLVLGTVNLAVFHVATAATTLTSVSDTMTNLNTSGSTSNDILFTIPVTTGGGFPLSGTITLTFASSTGTAPALAASIASSAIGVKVATNAQTIASGTASAGTPVAATTTAWGFARTSATVLTLTAPSSTATGLPVTAGTAVTMEVLLGTAAGGSNILTHGSSPNTETLVILTSQGDSQTIGMPIIANDQVVVTATVAPIITFNLTTVGGGTGGSALNAVDFGTLSSSSVKYATATPGGTTSTSTAANDLVVATNAASGYTLTYTAPTTLTDGSHPIAPATITNSHVGVPGTAQFAISGFMTAGTTSGSPAVTSSYRYSAASATSNWNFSTSSPVTLATNGAATSGDATSMRYIANIPSTQAPGNYSVTLTFIATGNF